MLTRTSIEPKIVDLMSNLTLTAPVCNGNIKFYIKMVIGRIGERKVPTRVRHSNFAKYSVSDRSS